MNKNNIRKKYLWKIFPKILAKNITENICKKYSRKVFVKNIGQNIREKYLPEFYLEFFQISPGFKIRPTKMAIFQDFLEFCEFWCVFGCYYVYLNPCFYKFYIPALDIKYCKWLLSFTHLRKKFLQKWCTLNEGKVGFQLSQMSTKKSEDVKPGSISRSGDEGPKL